MPHSEFWDWIQLNIMMNESRKDTENLVFQESDYHLKVPAFMKVEQMRPLMEILEVCLWCEKGLDWNAESSPFSQTIDQIF